MKRKTQKKFLLVVSYFTIFMLAITACGKKEYRKGFKQGQRIEWLYKLDSALVLSRQEGKPIMIDFTAEWCPPCRKMEDSTFSRSDVIRKSEDFIPVRIDVDKQRDVAIKYDGNAQKYGGVGIPNILFMTGDEERIKHIIGYHDQEALLEVMDSVLVDFNER